MMQQLYKPADLRELRVSAAELARYREEAKERFEAAAVRGDVAAAQEILKEATLKTQAYEDLRTTLGKAEVFLAKYGVEVINDHTILFVLPKGVSRWKMLEEANELVYDRVLVCFGQLQDWMKDRLTGVTNDFEKLPDTPECILINGHVQSGHGKDRATQEALVQSMGLALPSLADLAAAFAAHYVATGEPLFGWYNESAGWSFSVRAVGGGLYFGGDGLLVLGIGDGVSKSNIAVSARIPPTSPNLCKTARN